MLEGCAESQTESTRVHQSLYFYVLPRTTTASVVNFHLHNYKGTCRVTRRQDAATRLSAAQGLSSELLRLRLYRYSSPESSSWDRRRRGGAWQSGSVSSYKYVSV